MSLTDQALGRELKRQAKRMLLSAVGLAVGIVVALFVAYVLLCGAEELFAIWERHQP
jgi:hypothetical protein